jgi:DNA-binding MarR family transcriptional regulator
MSSEKRELFEALLLEVRRSQNATDRFDQAVADAIGLNRTDMRCVDVIDREGPVPAGRLAEATGLTTGAITTVLDRLEGAGYARRVRDLADRRRVLVELSAQARAQVHGFYEPHRALSESLYRRYTREQMELLLEFVRAGREFNEQHVAEVEASNRTARSTRGPVSPRAAPPGK